MKKNMGGVDRAFRMILAVVIAILYLTDTIRGMDAAVLLVFAALFVVTSMTSICPLYKLIGINSFRE